MTSKEDFLYPRGRYYGHVKPENLLFNANLQEFAQNVSFICNLETGGKISSLEAYQKIKALCLQKCTAGLLIYLLVIYVKGVR